MFKPTYKKNAVTRAITTAMPLFLLAGHAAQAHQPLPAPRLMMAT